jgi:uncharacterized membrane protein
LSDFDYLSVLISIVLGLGITNLLGGLATLVRRRSHIAMYWPLPVWIVTLFLIHVQTWWAMFGLRQVPHWSFEAFLVVLMQPVLLYLMSALIVPEPADGETKVDLRETYFRERGWFFACFLAVLCVSLSKDLVLSGHLPAWPNLGAHIVFILFALIGIATKSDLVHKFLAPFGFLILCTYIAVLFTRLA